ETERRPTRNVDASGAVTPATTATCIFQTWCLVILPCSRDRTTPTMKIPCPIRRSRCLVPVNKVEAIRTQQWVDGGQNRWSLYKISEPRQFSEDTEVWGYLLIEKKLATFYIVVRTTWFEYDQRFETQAFPADNLGKPLHYLELFQEL